MKITFIQTGGSIDKLYPTSLSAYAFEIGRSAIYSILERTNPNFEYKVIELLKKDSLDITDEDRQKLFDAVQNCEDDKIIITHGTDTMILSAEKLSTIQGKTIVFAGASLPEAFKETDADFNIGFAVSASQILQNGVYVAMNGRIYPWNKVKKIASGQFIEI